MRTSVVGLALAALLVLPQASTAQWSRSGSGPRQPRFYFGGAALMGQPDGEFRDNVPRSWGGSGNMLVRADGRGIVGLRVDGGFMVYGHESKRVPFSETVGDRVHVNVSTDNNIAYFGVGPQLMMPNGKLRPYIAGTVGVAYFFTMSSVDGRNGSDHSITDTNYDDANLAYSGIGGVYVPLHRGASPVSLDLSVQYHNNGVASYLRKGSISDNADGSISFTPLRSQADVVSFHVGAVVGVGPSHHNNDRHHRGRRH
jgi:hypothetical protein